jgi:hypothetical protein
VRSVDVEVEFYSGRRADETPRRIILNDAVHVVARLLSESVEQSASTKQETRRYKVLTDQGEVLEIVRSPEGTWRLVSA